MAAVEGGQGRKRPGSLGPDVTGAGPGTGMGVAEWSWPEVCDVWRPHVLGLPSKGITDHLCQLFWSEGLGWWGVAVGSVLPQIHTASLQCINRNVINLALA